MKKLLLSLSISIFSSTSLASFWGERVPTSTGQYIGGGAVGTFVGFGIGHAIQGRYQEAGWIFTTAEIASLGLIVYGFGSCEKDANGKTSSRCGTLSLGLTGVFISRVFEIIDVWAGAYPNDSGPKVFMIPDPQHPTLGISYNF